MLKSLLLSFPFCLWMLLACSSTPKLNQNQVSLEEANRWLQNFCTSNLFHRELTGDWVMKANTREFKGQYPASVHFEKAGSFQLEVTNIIGGTLVSLAGNDDGISIAVPSKPKLNRSKITHYLGIEMPVLSLLLFGSLPCPSNWKAARLMVDGPRMMVETSRWKWIFERAQDSEQAVPVRLTLVSMEEGGPSQKQILMEIENWSVTEHFAKKVSIKSPEGELKWLWRSREEK